MGKKVDEIIQDVPSQRHVEGRFSFIKNKILRVNIAVAFQYIIFLISLEEESRFPGPVSYSLYKDIVFYTASVVESVLHYCVQEYIDAGLVKEEDIMPSHWEYKNCKKIYEMSEKEDLYLATGTKKYEEFGNKTISLVVNRAAKKAEILTDNLFERAEKLREERNKIHLAALEMIDDYYSKSDIEEAFESAQKIIERIEGLLKSL